MDAGLFMAGCGFFSVQTWHRGTIGFCAHPNRISRFYRPFNNRE
jgi:hypothetical protein